jgi:hypothetical protein
VRWLLAAIAVGATLLGGPVSTSLAADPTPISSPVLIDPLDPRTGDEAGAVGAPLLAFLVVIGSGVLVAAVTFAYVRLTGRRSRAP